MDEGTRRCPRCGAAARPSSLPSVVHLLVFAALAIAMVVGVDRLWQAARDHGNAEASKDAIVGKPRKSVLVATTAAPLANPAPAADPAAPTAVPAPVAAPQVVTARTVEASESAPPANNGCAQPTAYDPQLVQDGDPSTAWRVAGDGVNQTMTLTMAQATHLTQVGLLPGYEKTDACTGAYRFKQLRRIERVTWTFDGGNTIVQTFRDEPTIQHLPVDVTATTVVITIASTIEGNGGKNLDYAAIAEVQLVGIGVR